MYLPFLTYGTCLHVPDRPAIREGEVRYGGEVAGALGALGALGITSSRKFASGDKKVEWTGLMREARLAIVDETQPFMRQDLSSRQIWPTGESADRLLVPACLPWLQSRKGEGTMAIAVHPGVASTGRTARHARGDHL